MHSPSSDTLQLFLSVGQTYTPELEAFVAAFERCCVTKNCKSLTVGRGVYFAEQPVFSARRLMEAADGVVVLAFTRTLVERGRDMPDSPKSKPLGKRRHPTIWNQLEAAMAYGLRKPMLVVLENAVKEEAMMRERVEYRVLKTHIDATFFNEAEFEGTFSDWLQKIRDEKNAKLAESHAKAAQKSTQESFGDLTISEFFKRLKMREFWPILVALFGIIAGVAIGGYWLGNKFSEHQKAPNTSTNPK